MRSLKKYVSLGLDHLNGDVWTVRLAHEDPDEGEPVAVVSSTGPSSSTAIRVGLAQLTKGYRVACRLPRSSSSEGALLEGEQLGDRLGDLFEFGVDRAHPRRLPLYVYGDAAFDAPSEQREPHDYARVTSCETTALVETEDPRRAVVVCELALEWRKVTRDPANRITERVGLDYGRLR